MVIKTFKSDCRIYTLVMNQIFIEFLHEGGVWPWGTWDNADRAIYTYAYGGPGTGKISNAKPWM